MALQRLPLWLARLSIRAPQLSLGIATGLTLFAIGLTLRLSIHNDFVELLPQDMPQVAQIRVLLDHLDGLGYQAVLVRSSNPKANRQFLTKLAQRLPALTWEPAFPSAAEALATDQKRIHRLYHDILRETRRIQPLYPSLRQRIRHITKARLVEYAFSGLSSPVLRQHHLLFLDLADIQKIRSQLRTQIRRKQPGYISLLDDAAEPFALQNITRKYEARRVFPTRIARKVGSTHYAALLIRPRGIPTDLNFSQAFIGQLQAQLRALRPSSTQTQMRISLIGGFSANLWEYRGITRDLGSSMGLTLLCLLLLLGFYFRRKRVLWLIPIPLLMGVIWSFAFAAVSVGYLNPITAFIGSLLLGFGVDYGIYLLSRYFQERATGASIHEALEQTYTQTGRAITTAAMTTAAAFLALQACQFGGFSQFGLLAGAGILCCLLAMVTVLPALLVWSEMRAPMPIAVRPKTSVAEATAFPGARMWLVVALLVLGTSLWLARGIHFETDMTKLSFKGEGLGTQAKRWKPLAQLMPVGAMTPLLFLAQTKAQAQAIVAEVKKRNHAYKAKHPKKQAPVFAVFSIHDFIPAKQGQKQKELRRIRRLIEHNDLPNLLETKTQRRALLRFQTGLSPEVLQRAQLPFFLRRDLLQYRSRDPFQVRRHFVVVMSRWNLADGHIAQDINRFLSGIQLQDKRFRAVGESTVLGQMFRIIELDSWVAVLASLCAMLLLVWLDLRRLFLVLFSLWPLLIGMLAMTGIMVATGLSLNFYNMLVLPVLLGMGVDGGVHLLYRYQERPQDGVFGAVKDVAGPLCLASTTTVISFASLLVAQHQGLFSIGLVAIIGLGTCLLSALVFLPALLQWRASRTS